METVSKILNTTVISVGDGPGLTVLEITIAVLTLLIGFWFARWAERKMSSRLERREVDAGVVQLIRRLFYTLVIVVLVITTLDLLNIPLTAFAFITGAVAIGVGFGAQNIINNFISGWILMWERPIRIGDFLELGHVENIIAMFRQDRSLYSLTGELIRDERFTVRLGVAVLFEELATLRPDDLHLAIPALLPLLEESNPILRGEAATILGIIGDGEAIANLRTLQNDPDQQVLEIVTDILAQQRTSNTAD